MSLYRLVYRKVCHLPVELEHEAYWAIKKFNFDMAAGGAHHCLQLNELKEIHNASYENAKIYKDRMKDFHNNHIVVKSFEPRQKVWLFNSMLKLFLGKLRSCYHGPYVVNRVFPHGVIEIKDPMTDTLLKFNG
ncbi:uncharacterized protein LOC131167945 [Malania oleifera]|uniref:uncharacterized protein LOC131167945 n=1 Tax=Malania oleifera TaxID=397392 RepID=UPI0025AE279D|nr:uncharacterized protein LOC131167945 [Malania oleifera]